jgi:hypothetical protein
MGVDTPAETAYEPEIRAGEQVDAYLMWRLDANGQAVRASLPRTDLPAFLPVVVEGLNENWSVQLLDSARHWPNHRALPVREGRAYAQLDISETDTAPFIGHPVTCDRDEVRITVSWETKGMWYVEAHNPTENALRTSLSTSPGWDVFEFSEVVDLEGGSSRTWHVKVRDGDD